MTNYRGENPIYRTVPVLGICGFSGAGKTTLIEKIVKAQQQLGRRICVLKSDTHGLSVDREGKDSYRLFESGADVWLQSAREGFFRFRGSSTHALQDVIQMLAPFYDGMLLEGHKGADVPNKVWLLHPENKSVPNISGEFKWVLDRDANRFGMVGQLFNEIITECWTRAPVYGAVLIGGDSKRYGSPKHLEKTVDGRTWFERTVQILYPHVTQLVVLGKGAIPESFTHLPRLWDVPDCSGPIAGMRAAFRWQPLGAWLMMPCDLPLLHSDAVDWLLSQREVGVEAVMPRLASSAPVEPLFAWYDFRCGYLAEKVDSPWRLSEVARSKTPLVPAPLKHAWTNINSPNDFR